MKFLQPLSRKATKYLVVIALAGTAFFSYSFVENYFEISKNLDIYATMFRELNLYYVDETNPGELVTNSIDAMLENLDPYTVYIPESDIEDYRFMLSGEYGGVGALISIHDGKIIITEPYEGFAADKAGLIAGDQILEVDGISTEGKNTEDISKLLKGQAGTDVSLKVSREGEMLEKMLTRQEVKVPDVPYHGMLDDKTGYIKLTSFTQTASAEVKKAFNELKDEHSMEQLVFDLRGNGGGLLREAVNIVNMFVPRGQEVVSTRGKVKKWDKVHATLNSPTDLEIPVTVLVDGGSASASEIVSGALQDLDRAVVVGGNTYGKGLVQQTRDLSYNSKLKLTIAKYYTPSGRCIQKIDYSHRNETGKAEEVPDSLISYWKTKNGREVRDGSGVDPEVEVDRTEYSEITRALVVNHLIFDYVTEYKRTHESIGAAKSFRLTDDEFEKFSAWLAGKEYDYTTKTQKMLEELAETAKNEKYMSGGDEEFAALKKKFTPSKTEDLKRFKSEIMDLIESEIVVRYHYRNGRIQHSLDKDEYVKNALKVLNDKAMYDGILAGTWEK